MQTVPRTSLLKHRDSEDDDEAIMTQPVYFGRPFVPDEVLCLKTRRSSHFVWLDLDIVSFPRSWNLLHHTCPCHFYHLFWVNRHCKYNVSDINLMQWPPFRKESGGERLFRLLSGVEGSTLPPCTYLPLPVFAPDALATTLIAILIT